MHETSITVTMTPFSIAVRYHLLRPKCPKIPSNGSTVTIRISAPKMVDTASMASRTVLIFWPTPNTPCNRWGILRRTQATESRRLSQGSLTKPLQPRYLANLQWFGQPSPVRLTRLQMEHAQTALSKLKHLRESMDEP